MASERPHLVATYALHQSAYQLFRKFQWPLNGHTSLRRPATRLRRWNSSSFQWPLNGHTSLRRLRSARAETITPTFQWPLNGHTSLRLPEAVTQPDEQGPFQWPLNGHTSLRPDFGEEHELRSSDSVSMASERPHLVATSGALGVADPAPVKVSMASERPHLVATPRGATGHPAGPVLVSMASERPHLVATRRPGRCWHDVAKFQWPLNGHTSLRREVLWSEPRCRVRVSMASERPHLVATGSARGVGACVTRFNGL